MKRQPHILAVAALAAAAVLSCAPEVIQPDDTPQDPSEVVDHDKEKPDGPEDPDKEQDPRDEGVNERLFILLDLSRGGLETVRTEYEAGHLYLAAEALKEYWLNGRGTVVNPDVEPNASVTLSASEKNIAEQALKENGYRFYVTNYSESTDPATGLPVFWSFMAPDGSIDWETTPTTERQFAIQKHRHQWIEPQAKAYAATGDEKYVRTILEVYSDWLKTFPCPGAESGNYAIPSNHSLRDHWTDLQATERLSVYINVIDRCLRSEAFTPEALTHVLASLYDTVECIRANTYYKEASNHRQFEVQAVWTAAVLLPEFAKSVDWESDSIRDISTQSNIQFADDGVQNEMDPSYHISVISVFNRMHTLAVLNGKESLLPGDFVSRLHSACTFVRDIVYPDYSIDNFNDVSSVSWTPRVLKRNFTEYSDLFPDDMTFLWMWTGRLQGSSPKENFTAYRKSGWFMFRSGWTEQDMMLILKNNHNEEKWWHCQPDNGTVGLYRDGRHFLPDAGVYTYGGSAADNAVRDEFRATKNHNTLTLDEATISDNNMLGKFIAESHSDLYDAVRTGNQSYPALRHERTVFHVKDSDFFVIADAGIGTATGNVAVHWHFCKPESDSQTPQSIVTYARDGHSFTATTAFPDANNMMFKTFCFNGNNNTAPSGDWTATTSTSWTSDAIGMKTERPCVSISHPKTEGAPVRFITVILPVTAASSAPAAEASFISENAMEVTVGAKTYTLNIPQ